MARLHHLKIQHFRGIESFEQTFETGITCIIGRGDSGKSTILDAIAYVFSQSWSVHLNDSDFYMCNTASSIVIEGTVVGIPDILASKFNNHIRGISEDGSIIDDMESEEAINAQPALTIQLKVTKDLEPTWSVISDHGEEPTTIKAIDRGKLNVFAVADYTDRHFSLNKGNPLYSLYKQINGDTIDEENRVLDVVREAKTAFDRSIETKFNDVIKIIKNEAETLGITLNDLNAKLDHRDIAISENKVSIHENEVPFRLKGKASKRLLSLSIQLALTQPTGIILIDEIEQGLEPDRVQHLVSELAKKKDMQIILTTHSSNVVVEIPCNSLYIMRESNSSLLHVEGELQNCIRKNPEAFFATKVIVCEGATEVGLCRAINQFRIDRGLPPAACKGVRFADGSGNAMKDYVLDFRSLDYPTALFCDSDPGGKKINDMKQEFRDNGVEIVDCENGYSIEGQIFKDVPWNVVRDLLALYIDNKANSDSITSEQISKDIL